MMSRENFMEHLIKMHDVNLAERQAAKELKVVQLLELMAEKQTLLKKILPLSDTAELTQEEKELSEAVYSENLRNAFFLSSALRWVGESMGFIGEKIPLLKRLMKSVETAFEAALNVTSRISKLDYVNWFLSLYKILKLVRNPMFIITPLLLYTSWIKLGFSRKPLELFLV